MHTQVNMVLKPFTFWEHLILGGLIVFSLWQRYDWGMHLMLQAVTWRDLHQNCWCYAGCISQMCVCVIVQSDIHWCMSSTCLGRDCKWKRVSLSKSMCLFVCLHSIAYPPHFHSYLSSLCMANHECTHPALKSWQCVCWCQAPACFRDYILTFFFLWYPQEEQREAGILRRFWGFPLSFCDEGCWKSLR